MLVKTNEKDIFKGADPEELAKRREGMISYKDISDLEETILEIARDEADKIYRDLEKQYDYLMSDEGVREDLINNERMFDVDPETGLLNEAKNIFKGAGKKDLAVRQKAKEEMEAKEKAARIKSGSVYFTDLTPEDQDKVIEQTKNNDDYPGYDWWEGDIGTRWRGKDGQEHQSKGYYDEELEKKGFLDTEIHFSGFYSQGDGASFECKLDIEKIVNHYKIDLKPAMWQGLIDGAFYGKITTSGRYSHSNTMEINIEYEGDVYESRVTEADIFKGASPEEFAARQPEGYKSLNDVFPAGDTEIWYFKSTGTDTEYGQEADLMMGYEWCRKKGCLPDPNHLEKTHVLLGKIALTDRDEIFMRLQGDEWSPNGEARPLIAGKGLHHTSMSVGDIMKIGDKVIFVDAWGFAELNESIKEAEEEDIFKGASQEELEQRPGWREAQDEESRWRAEREERRRRIEQRHITQPDSRALIDQFVNGSRTKGKAASLSVQGNALFSYATPIAVRYNGIIYMVNQKFSRTTSKQQSYIRMAARGTVTAVPVPEFKRMLDELGVDYGYSRLREHVSESLAFKPTLWKIREKDIFKGASKKELDQRKMEWVKALHKTGVQIDYIKEPIPDRLSSFWYEGDVAKVTYATPEGEVRSISIVANGDIRVTFVGDEQDYQNWRAVEEAESRGYTDEDLGEADYEEPHGEYHGKVTNWENNNWFELFYGSSKWPGHEEDIMGDTYGSYDEALEAAVAAVKDEEFWSQFNESVNEKDIFKGASKEETAKRQAEWQATHPFMYHVFDWDDLNNKTDEWFEGPHAYEDAEEYAKKLVRSGYEKVRIEKLEHEEQDPGDMVWSGGGSPEDKDWGEDDYTREQAEADLKAGLQGIEESVNEKDKDIFKGASQADLVARGTIKYLPKPGPVDYQFLKYIDVADPDDKNWKFVGVGELVNYDLSDVYFYKNDEPEFNIYYDTETIIHDNMEKSDKLTDEVQVFTEEEKGDEEDWIKSKGWEVEYSGSSSNEDPSYFWSDTDFSYVSFSAPDDDIRGGAVINFAGRAPVVYLGDLNDVFSALHASDPEQDIADIFGYTHYENLIHDMKKYRGTLTPEEEQAPRSPERVPGQLNWTFGTKNAGPEYYVESKMNEADDSIFVGASNTEVTARRARAKQLEKERKAKRSAEMKAYYGAIPYTYDDIINLPQYKALVKLPGVGDFTTNLQKAHRTLTFQLAYTLKRDGTVRTVYYYVYANGYLRAKSWGEQSIITKRDLATTIEAYGVLLDIMKDVLKRKIAKEKRRPPFDTSYECEVCGTPGSLFHNAYIRWSYLPRHNYGTRLGNAHLKDPRNAAELARLQAKAVANGSEIKL